MKFDPETIASQLSRIDPRLRAILYEVDRYLSTEGSQLTVTHLERSQFQQNAFYQDRIDNGFFVVIDGMKYYSEDHQVPTISVHQTVPCRGADVRSRDLPPPLREFIVSYVNKWWPYPGHHAALKHNVGLGDHIHIQVPTLKDIERR
mgnify:CR=1 FL=1